MTTFLKYVSTSFYLDIFPNYATESPPIGDLMSFYKESKKRFDEVIIYYLANYKLNAFSTVWISRTMLLDM